MKQIKTLIEATLPLEAINKAAAREKSIRHGHPSTLRLWWARRPLAAARAVIFAQMVDDPSSHPDVFKTEKRLAGTPRSPDSAALKSRRCRFPLQCARRRTLGVPHHLGAASSKE